MFVALLALSWACSDSGARPAPDDDHDDPGGSGDRCTTGCSADGTTAHYCDGSGDQMSLTCPSDLGSSCDESYAWCDCGGVTADGVCYDDPSGDVDLVVCERGELTFYECVPGTSCDVDGDGFADCVCDNADDGVCPHPSCTEDPDCQDCTPECGDRECGDNGCGGSCGSCPVGTSCDADGQCEPEGGDDSGGDGSPWSAQRSGTTADLYGVTTTLATTEDHAVYAVGDGAILRRLASWGHDDARWEDPGIDDKLWLGVSTDRFGIGSYAVSLEGHVARRDDPLGWRTTTSGSLGTFNDVALRNYNNGILVGMDGAIYLLVDGSLSSFESGVTAHLREAWIDDDNVFVVGDEGTILGREGSGFQSLSSPVSGDLVGIAGSSPEELWAVTDDGEVIRRGADGEFVLAEEQPTDVLAASALWAEGDQVWIAAAPSVHYWDGQSWTEEETSLPLSTRLNDIVGREARFGGIELWAVGDEGTILYRSPQ